jgi:hypothetical protein
VLQIAVCEEIPLGHVERIMLNARHWRQVRLIRRGMSWHATNDHDYTCEAEERDPSPRPYCDVVPECASIATFSIGNMVLILCLVATESICRQDEATMKSA